LHDFAIIYGARTLLKAVIFDLDGVIVKFNLDSRRIKEEVINFFVGNGMPEGFLSPDQPFSKIKESVREVLLKDDKDKNFVEELIRKAEVIPVNHEVKAANETQLLPGVIETLMALKSMGLKLAIFTYNNSKAADIALCKNGISGYFSVIVTRDMVDRPKPNPIHLEIVLKALGVEKDEALVVGDSEMDIRPSKDLGVKVVALATGIRTAEELRSHNPDYLITNMSDLIGVVAAFKAK